MSFPDRSHASLIEALWEAEKEFGQRLSVNDQMAVVEAFEAKPLSGLNPEDVKEAFDCAGLIRPSTAYARTVLSSIRTRKTRPGLREVLLRYRQVAISVDSRRFGGNTRGREDELRSTLLYYLPERGYKEAHAGRGRTDIVLPPLEDAIIECKVWTAPQAYRDGLEELAHYIHTERPKKAFMIVFGSREPLPSIINDHRQEIAEEPILEGLRVPVIVVPFEVVAPSKAGREARRRSARGR